MSSDSQQSLAYPLTQHTLDNGLRVVISPDHAAPSVAVNLWYDVGSRHEQPGRTGFAHLFEHVMFQGSANVASGQHIALMQSAGAAVNATTWFDRTNYFEALPTGGLDLALWLEADRMGTLLTALTQENLDTQREVVKEEKRQRYDNVPYGDVMERLIGLTFPTDHPYGHTTIGSMDDLNAATLEDVHSFFTQHYMPNNAVLSIVGDVDVPTGLAKAATYFGPVPAGTPPPEPPTHVLPPMADLPRAETAAEVPAEAVYLTWRLPARGSTTFDALDLAFTVLGHGQTSRLHKALVRQQEIAEASSASTMGLIGGNSFGFAQARARDGVSLERLEEALLVEVDRLAADGPSETELRRAKAQFERHWLHELARVDSRADEISAHTLLHNDPTLINTRIAEIDAIDPAAIAEATREWFDTGTRATLIYRQVSR
ncbi:pitrilysin family protein [Microlunatus panaciterrae]|uniref:Zn-dependent peptidase n=1 Tax=Microlunatus panaciterrae TaxID=400768 RepID=A0ABS2RFK6_9ACTN|nr:pitrilysin family protein [Microlunatus panaciterrae]MBM7797478.1 putative Zn-dependent peptidase [Microlunatus panaciterrae]